MLWTTITTTHFDHIKMELIIVTFNHVSKTFRHTVIKASKIFDKDVYLKNSGKNLVKFLLFRFVLKSRDHKINGNKPQKILNGFITFY